MVNEFEPKLITCMKEGYSRQRFTRDVTAGVITGIVALPLAIAFGIASGVTPQQGLYTAIIAGLIISLLSGSRVQIGGPTGAFIVIVYGIIQKFGIDGLTTATVMAGVILLLMGALKLGNVIRYIPYPVTLGFTTGIAVIIASIQIRDLLGLDMTTVPSDFHHKIIAYCRSIHTRNLWAVGISAVTIFILIYWPRVTSKFPGSLVAIILCTLAAKIFNIPVATVGQKFGQISGALPGFSVAGINLEMFSELLPAAFSIAILGAIESLLSAVVADGMIGTRHKSNMELVAQGAANIITPFFGGIPATGAIARTATNIKSGGRTPVAGVVHSIVLLLILICLGPMASMIPLAVLAGILLLVAVKMSEYRLFIRMFRAPKSDIAIMLCTFGLTVIMDLTVAIPAGIVLASFLFMRRMEQVSGTAVLGSDDIDEEDEIHDPFALSKFQVPKGVEVFEINGPFFFGVARKFLVAITARKARVLVLRMRKVPAIDATGLFALEDIVKRARKKGSDVIFSGLHPQPMNVLQKAGLLETIGSHNIHKNIAHALIRAGDILAESADE